MILYIIENDLNLYKILNKKIKAPTLIDNLLDYYGEIKGEYLSSFLNIYYIDKIIIEKKYKHQNFDIFLLNNILKILMYKDKKIIGNVILKIELDYKIEKSSTIEYYKYEENLNNLITAYKKCRFEKIKIQII